MCHLHGLEKRDHKSLHHMPASVLDALLHPMWDISFTPSSRWKYSVWMTS